MSKGLKPQLKKNVADTEKNKAFNRANRDFQLYFSNRIYSFKKNSQFFGNILAEEALISGNIFFLRPGLSDLLLANDGKIMQNHNHDYDDTKRQPNQRDRWM